MWWFWRRLSSMVIRGNYDSHKNARLNALLPPSRSEAVQKARTQAGDELKGFTKLAMAGSFTAVATLAGFAELFGPEGRSSLHHAAAFLALAGVAATVSLLLSIIEPTFRAAVRSRLDPPDEPMTDEEDYHFSEAVNDRLWQAPMILRDALLWRLVSGVKTIALLLCAGSFCGALVVAVGALR